jgi:hypothetical protein
MVVESGCATNLFVEPIFCFALHKIDSGVWGLHKNAAILQKAFALSCIHPML